MTTQVTERLIQVLKDHKTANQQEIIDRVVNCPFVLPPDHERRLAQLKAQINTIDLILDFKEFLLTDEEKDEIPSPGTESTSQSQEI